MHRSQGRDNWAAMHRAFGWRVPRSFNIAQACCGRWARRPDAGERVAIIAHGAPGAATLTFAQLQREANAMSRLLAGLGVERGDRVAIVMPQRFETAIAYMAVLQLGAVAMPLLQDTLLQLLVRLFLSAALLAATSNLGKLFRLSQSLSDRGTYESPVHDAGNAARWGRIEWRAEKGSGSLAFRTRSGNSERPDKTWSDWSPANSDSTSAQVPSPNARYLQWQVELRGGGAVPPVLDSVTVTYQPRNGRPTVRSVQAYPQWVGDPSKAAAQAQSTGAAYSITVTDTGQASAAATSAGTPTQAMARSGRPQIYLSWMADDPEGDPRLQRPLPRRGERE